jgi:hypothetical protein
LVKASAWSLGVLINYVTSEAALASGLVAEQVDSVPAERVCKSTRAPDKSQFTLFNPVPEWLMREMNTDRPDTTESPYTVDAGHFQFELSLANYTYIEDESVKTETFSVLPTNLKVGLLNNVDIQFVFTPYVHEQAKALGNEVVTAGFSNTTQDGFSDDTQVRLKINLWGNDGSELGFGDTALAVMPFIKFPTGSDELTNNHVEGGVIFPLAVALPSEFGLGVMAEVDFVYNELKEDYGIDFVHTATIGHNIAGNLAGYIEYVGVAPQGTGGTYQAIGSAGLTYRLTDDWIVDFGGTGSPSDSADDFTVFVGTSFRL